MATTSTSLPPASLPIRTSSQPHSPPQPATAAAYDTRGYTSRPPRSQGQSGYGDEGEGDRQRGQRSSRDPPPPSTTRSDRHRTAPAQSRSATAVGQPPVGTDLPRENSAIINRIVVDDPEADLARERARQAEAAPHAGPADVNAMNMAEAADAPPVPRSRHEHLQKHQSGSRRESKFGDYILGNTIGSGEFGKVKMGWKKDSPVQVAVKLIRKDMVGNTNRQAKIEREIDILKNLKHPNIVRLHEFVETERYMGIILEYASGGELFDYILTHRYLKDPAARRLFAQLISGVGYLHANGIVHRDLKLENLLLDRNKHIIITDFGFANTFDPNDELPDSIVGRIMDKDYVKREGLDKLRPRKDGKPGGWRRGDLMQTSCGSPCYAAPELVVHDGLYTGRLVDVWSCGVILYAMLAGYLPFDDDPANPDGDNINLLYKYICSTPLTFPEFVSPHARDLLRRILVPEPRHRADLFEVARHSWLSEYSHVVGFIGSRVMSPDASQAAMMNEEDPQLGRSASVREPSTRSPAVDASNRASTFIPKHGPSASVGGDETADFKRQQRDAKRRTVQIEYPYDAQTAPRTERNPITPAQSKPAPAPAPTSSGLPSGKTRASAQAQGPVEVSSKRDDMAMAPPSWGPGQRPMSGQADLAAQCTSSRPNTSGTFGAANRLPSRGNSYSQPAAAQPTNTTAQGSFSQPKSNSGYIIAGSMSGEGAVDASGRPVSEQNRTGGQYANAPQQSYHQQSRPAPAQTGHRRSSTLGSLADKVLNRTSSRRTSQQENGASPNEKRDRRYPPVSMKNTMPQTPQEESGPRPSSDSRRPSFGFTRKASKERDSSVQGRRASGRRFSWLPGSLSMASFTGKKDQGYESGDDGYRPPPMSQQSQQSRMSRPPSKGMAFGRGTSDAPSEEMTNSTIPLHYDAEREKVRDQRRQQARYDKALPPSPGVEQGYSAQRTTSQQHPGSPGVQRRQFRDDGYGSNMLDQDGQEPVERYYTPNQESVMSSPQTQHGQYGLSGQGEWEQYEPNQRQQGLRPQQRRLGDDHGRGGSSNAAKRVMNYFRSKRGKDMEA